MIPHNPAPPELRKVFQSETGDPRQEKHLPPAVPSITPHICYFHDGTHYGPPGCDHERDEDELGPVIPQGWTVQQQ